MSSRSRCETLASAGSSPTLTPSIPSAVTAAPTGRGQIGVRWDRDIGRWTGPFAMAAINARVVRRTNALLSYAYGRDFRYHEAMSLARGPRGLLAATAVSLATPAFFGAMAIPPVRSLIARRLPAPGEGPSREIRDNGFFVTRLVGIGEASNGSPAPKVFVTVKGTGDPGYGATSRMLAESAVCLALDGDSISGQGGVLTPAACMGSRLVERLDGAGIVFGEVDRFVP